MPPPASSSIDPRKYGTIQKVATKIGVKENVLRYWLKAEKLEAIKLVGGTRIVKVADARKVKRAMDKRKKK